MGPGISSLCIFSCSLPRQGGGRTLVRLDLYIELLSQRRLKRNRVVTLILII